MTVHHFDPDHYFTTMGAHEPVLVIQDGDTVITTCVDARGADVNNQLVTPRGNPMTGPFYVKEAEPGDSLVITLDKVMPNRALGWSRKIMAPNVIEPDFVSEQPVFDESNVLAEWSVDMDAGTATLMKPVHTSLGQLTLPVRPMVGCFGVAPQDGQAISTATSAEHGGNMDYRHFVQGVTVYFPVFVEGGLFHIGDGHAMQGDGEMAGTGIEISMDVQFTVRLRKQQPIGWPRGENDEYIFTCGNARPLDQAVQHATTEMIRWLVNDYGYDSVGAQLLMGQTVEYDLGNMYDPAYTMVCKMPKRVLALAK